MARNLFILALEPSSNMFLEKLLEHLLDGQVRVKIRGIYSSSLLDRFEAVERPLFELSSFCVMGFSSVIKKLPFMLSARETVLKEALKSELVLLMDASAFNLPLAKRIRSRASGVNVIIFYYILPQAWVWKKYRIKVLNAYCDYLLSTLPFEQGIYSSYLHACGIPKKAQMSYVGHPLLDFMGSRVDGKVEEIAEEKRDTIAFMPGSRMTEIELIFPIFRELKGVLEGRERSDPPIFTLVVPANFKGMNLEDIYGDIHGFNISFDAPSTLARSKFAFICSGSATLQAALYATPFVLVYKVKALDRFIASYFLNIKYIGLANIFFHHMGKPPMHQELLQDDISISNLLNAYERRDELKSNKHAKELINYLVIGSASNVSKALKKHLEKNEVSYE